MPKTSYVITEEEARRMPRFAFIASWLVKATKKPANRGKLGLWVRRSGSWYEVVSPIAGGTVTYRTQDPALLFDYVRRGQLNVHVRDAEEFRGLAHARAEQVAIDAKSPQQLDREIAEYLATEKP